MTATYSVTAPGGLFHVADNGTYTVNVGANVVRDLNGDGNTASSTTFTVAVPVTDSTPPTAVLSAPNIQGANVTAETITIVYGDNIAVDASSITTGNISVVGPNNQPLTVTAVGKNPNANAASIVASYTVAAPNGTFTAADNGAYTVTLGAGQVKDTSGNAAAAVSTSFSVNVGNVVPTAAITAPAIATGGTATEPVTVVFSEPGGTLSFGSAIATALTATGPTGASVPVTLTNTTGSGAAVTATFAVAAPGGSWQAIDDGTYTLNLQANTVADALSHGNPAASATFNVNIPLPTVLTGVITAPNVVSTTPANETVTVDYSDNNFPINTSTLAGSNLTITGPGARRYRRDSPALPAAAAPSPRLTSSRPPAAI